MLTSKQRAYLRGIASTYETIFQVGKGGVMMGDRGAVCLETQLWPDGTNHWGFPSAVLHAGEQAHSVTTYSFSVIK